MKGRKERWKKLKGARKVNKEEGKEYKNEGIVGLTTNEDKRRAERKEGEKERVTKMVRKKKRKKEEGEGEGYDRYR